MRPLTPTPATGPQAPEVSATREEKQPAKYSIRDLESIPLRDRDGDLLRVVDGRRAEALIAAGAVELVTTGRRPYLRLRPGVQTARGFRLDCQAEANFTTRRTRIEHEHIKARCARYRR